MLKVEIEKNLLNTQRTIKRMKTRNLTTRKYMKDLEQENEDMRESYCTTFVRCEKCERLHDMDYKCPHCGWDGEPYED